MSRTFVKVYGSILRSSVWQQPMPTKVVWIAMLALAGEDGLVESSIPGLAATAGVSIAECEDALACLLAPDKYSSSRIDEGRRIRAVRGGWVIVNHRYYRELRTPKQVRDATLIASKRAAARVPAPSPEPEASSETRATSATCCDVADVAPEAEADTNMRSISSSSDANSDAPAAAIAVPEVRPKWTRPDVEAVFEFWRSEHGKPRSKLDAKRSARIKARLSEGFTVEHLCQAIRGAKRDPFLMGRDPRAGRVFDGLDTILRDAGQVERLLALEDGAAAGRGHEPEEGPWL